MVMPNFAKVGGGGKPPPPPGSDAYVSRGHLQDSYVLAVIVPFREFTTICVTNTYEQHQ